MDLSEIYEALDVKLSGMRKLIDRLDKDLDDEQCANATLRDENIELDGLREERDMLADENKKMATYLLYQQECNRIDLKKDGLGWLIID